MVYNSPSGITCFDRAGLTKPSAFSFCSEKSTLSGQAVFSPWLDMPLLPWWTHVMKIWKSCRTSISIWAAPQGYLCQPGISSLQPAHKGNGKVRCSGFTSPWKMITMEDSRGPCPAGFHQVAQPSSCWVSTFWSSSLPSSWANTAQEVLVGEGTDAVLQIKTRTKLK